MKIEIEVYSIDKQPSDNRTVNIWRINLGEWVKGFYLSTLNAWISADDGCEFPKDEISHWCELPDLNEVK